MKEKKEMMKSLYRKRTEAGWHCFRGWTRSKEKAEMLQRQYPPPKLESK